MLYPQLGVKNEEFDTFKPGTARPHTCHDHTPGLRVDQSQRQSWQRWRRASSQRGPQIFEGHKQGASHCSSLDALHQHMGAVACDQ